MKNVDLLRMSRAKARFLNQHERVQNVCATEEHAVGVRATAHQTIRTPQWMWGIKELWYIYICVNIGLKRKPMFCRFSSVILFEKYRSRGIS